MHRIRSVSEDDVRALADSIALRLAHGEASTIADRMDALGDVYAELEDARVPAPDAGAEERFSAGPRRPGPDEDPHNAWLARFDLRRPDASGPLDGLTVAVKDNVAVRGVELTCGSRAFEGVVPDAHAEVVERLLAAGGRILGKTNMDELAFGPTSETSAYGPTTNPAAADRVAGGSSSGSAAAVAAGDVDLAIGSDTGGSVRIPASYCGIVGIKPTYGLVPRRGFLALAYSMDHVGTLARDVRTAALGLEAIADASYVDDLGRDLDGVRVGVPTEFFEEYVTDEVEAAVRAAVDALADAGADVRECELPALAASRPAWWGIAPTEFAATFATNGIGLWRRGRVDPALAASAARVRRGSSRDFGPNVKAMLALGAHLLETHDGAHYVRAADLRAALTERVDALLSEVDVLAAPATPTTALEVGEFERGVTPPVNWNTHPTNLTGHPSVSVPCDTDGLPVGLQLIGARHEDGTVLDVAHEYERARTA